MIDKKHIHFFIIFSIIGAPFALIASVLFFRFWGRSLIIQLTIFSGFLFIISAIFTLGFIQLTKKFKKQIDPNKISIIILPFLIGLLLVQMPIWNPPQPIHRVQIQVLKERNQKSEGTHVELIEFKHGGKIIPLEDFEQLGLWYVKESSISSNANYGKELLYLSAPQYDFPVIEAQFLFNTSQESGIVAIQIDGQKEILDLYSNTPGQANISFELGKNDYAVFLNQRVRSRFITIGSTLILILFLSIIFILFNKTIIFYFKKILSVVQANYETQNRFSLPSINFHDSHRNRKILFFSAFLVVLVSATIFGFWFKTKQLGIIDPRLIKNYPIPYYLFTAITSCLIFLTLWALILIIEIKILHIQNSSIVYLFAGIPFLAFCGGVLGFSLQIQLMLFVMLLLINFIIFIRSNKTQYLEFIEPCMVLAGIILFFLFAMQSLSPIFHTNPFLDMWGKMDLIPVYESQWENAKAYDFSGMFTQKTRLGGNANGIGGNSEFLAVLSLVFDIPFVDLLAKYTLLQNFMFWMYIFGAFGMYLFLRFGLKLFLIPSIIGAIGFIFGNAAFLSYLGGEFFQHQGEYLFLPWVFFLLKKGYNKRTLSYIALAGLVAALPEFVWNVHPEMRIISYTLLNTYNLFLSLQAYLRSKKWKSLQWSLLSFFLFPFFLGLGISFRILHLVDLINSNEYSVLARYRVEDTPEHFIMWGPIKNQIFTLLFRYKNPTFIKRYQFSTAGSPVLYYLGQVFIFPVFFLLTDILTRVIRKKRPNSYSEDTIYFLTIFSLILLALLAGNALSLFSIFDPLPFNLHYPSRLLVYFFLFGLFVGVNALQILIKKIYSTQFLTSVYITYLLFILTVYLIAPIKPDNFSLEIVISTCVFMGIYLFHMSTHKACQLIIGIFLIITSLYSFFFSNGDAQKYLSPRIDSDPEFVFTSLRSAVANFQNNEHDLSSLKYINAQLIKLNISVDEEPSIRKDKINSIDQQNIESGDYYTYTDFLQTSKTTMVPLGVDILNSVNYFLPNNYTSIISGFPKDTDIRNSYVFGLGKHSDINSISHYGGFGLYPTISVYPYILLISGEKEYHTLFTFNLDNYIDNPFLQELSNIAGIDYIVYLESLYPNAFDQLNDGGFEFTYYDDQLGICIFKNLNSYGKAYLARQIEFIEPESYYANVLSPEENISWPYSPELIASFKEIIATTPQDISQSAIIEMPSKDRNGFVQNPAIGKLTIIKILGSKSIFDVNCRSEHCWMVYNSAYLKGWKAFIDSSETPIYRANLGFIGIQVPQGHHLVWLEYRPMSRLIGQMITFTVWFIISSLLILNCIKQKNE
ncbi:MAG TPA: YfhO family protein [Anaerolineae bacterium]|nr:YfhO family protein [Anaerolineae bacterium]